MRLANGDLASDMIQVMITVIIIAEKRKPWLTTQMKSLCGRTQTRAWILINGCRQMHSSHYGF